MARRHTLSHFSRTWLAYFLWAVACFGKLKGQDSVRVMQTTIGNNVLREWALLYREMRTEFLSCLYGLHHGDSVLVQFAVLANVRPSHSMVGGVSPVEDEPTCYTAPGLLVGIAHSHPRERRALSGERLPDAVNPCYESGEDVAMFVGSGVEVSVVVCGVGRVYLLRKGSRPNLDSQVCDYDPEAMPPLLVCGKPS